MNHPTLRLLLAFSVALGASGCCSTVKRQLAGCSASQVELERQRRNLEAAGDRARSEADRQVRELAQLREALSQLQARYEASEARRIQLEQSAVGLLTSRLEECQEGREKAIAEARHTGSLEGANSVLTAIQVIGSAEKVPGMIFDDHYYVFQVKLGNRAFVAFKVQTTKQEAGFGSALSAISGLTPAVLALIPK